MFSSECLTIKELLVPTVILFMLLIALLDIVEQRVLAQIDVQAKKISEKIDHLIDRKPTATSRR